MRISDWSSDVCSSDLHEWPLKRSLPIVRRNVANGLVERSLRRGVGDIPLAEDDERSAGVGLVDLKRCRRHVALEAVPTFFLCRAIAVPAEAPQGRLALIADRHWDDTPSSP